MTQRLKAFIVTLDHDIREDDAEPILQAIRCLKHVASVDPVGRDLTDITARMRVRGELAAKILEVYREILTPRE